MIARKLAYRIWSACIEGRACHLRMLCGTPSLDRAQRRGGTVGRDAAEAKRAARLEAAEQLEAAADIIHGWAGHPERCRGADVDPAAVAWVCALVHGESRAAAELRRLGLDDAGLDLRDVPAVITRLLS